MKIELVFIPPGGGEIDHSLLVEMPEIPKVNDYISILRPGEGGTEDFIVKRTWWHLGASDNGGNGTVRKISVDCEFALGPLPSEAHKEICEHYRAKTGILLNFQESTS